MRKIFFLLIIALLSAADVAAAPRAKSSTRQESLSYDVFFHMGFIWARAGRGNLVMTKEVGTDGQTRLHGQLAARSLSVVEHIMKVRDTLDCYMTPDYVPLEFCKKTQEGSYSAVERNFYTPYYKDSSQPKPTEIDSTKCEIRRWRNKKGNDAKTHVTSGIAYDMLSAFYGVRSHDFSKMKKGESYKVPVCAGVKLQWLVVEYHGLEKCKLRSGKQFQAHSVKLYFSTKDTDSQPLEVWLSNDAACRPLKVLIALSRVGSVQCELTSL